VVRGNVLGWLWCNKRIIFLGGGGVERETCDLIFSTDFSRKIYFLILRIIQRDIIGLHGNYPLFLSDMKLILIFSLDFQKTLKHQNS